MPVSQKTIAFISHSGFQNRLFGTIAKSLPEDVKVKYFLIHRHKIRARLSALFSRRKPPPEEVVDSFTNYHVMKKGLRLKGRAFQRLHRRLRARAVRWYHYFQPRLEGVDLLVVWNGNQSPASCAIAAAKERGIPVLFCENGVLPGMLAMDTAGINFRNSLSGMPAEFYRGIKMDPEKAEALSNIALKQRPLRKGFRPSNGDSDDAKQLPERYVLFAMQVHDDSQVLLFSPRFPSMESAIPYVAGRLKAYNERTGDDVKLVVKEHPSDFGRVDYSAMRASLPDAYFLRTTPVSEIVGKALAVLTLNSSVGVEALLYRRPVITLGDAFYNVPGVVHHVGAHDDLAIALEDAIDKQVDEDLIRKFLYFLCYEYLTNTPRLNVNKRNVGSAVQRVMDVLNSRLPWMK